MPARYHPISDSIWNDEALEGCPFEQIGFFAYLCSNHRVRPSGIYRATDEQIQVDTRLELDTVRAYLADLQARHRILRDGAWIFVRGYFKRQSHNKWLVAGVESDVGQCSSIPILCAWTEQYPFLSRPSVDRLETIARRSPDGGETVGRPRRETVLAEQSSSEQSKAVQSKGPSDGLRHSGSGNGSEPLATTIAKLLQDVADGKLTDEQAREAHPHLFPPRRQEAEKTGQGQ